MPSFPTASTARGSRVQMWDVVLALAAVALGIRVLAAAGGGEGFRRADAFAYVLTGVGCATLVLARRRPLVALVITGVAVLGLVTRDYHVDVLPFVVTGLLFMAASYSSRREAVLGLAVAGVSLAISAATKPADLGFAALVQTVAIFATAWILGRLVGARRSALLAQVSEAELRASAERELASVERDRSRLSLVEERLRIARDVHDVLAHSMSVVSVQATVGAHLAAQDPAAARQALLTISDVSRSSMQDLRQMLTLLRDDTATRPQDVSYEPARGLATIGPLIDTYRAAGLRVTTSTSGMPRDLSPSADLCAYRIVQEALTNTLKHARASGAEVELRYEESMVQITISDDGRGVGPTGAGHGLIGMRERTALVNGTLEAGRVAGGGFTVTATIPYCTEDVAP